MTDSLGSAQVEGKGGEPGQGRGQRWGCVSSWPRAGHRKSLPAEIAAGGASQRQPELAEWDGRRLAKYLLPAARLGLMLSALNVCDGSFHSSVLEKHGTAPVPTAVEAWNRECVKGPVKPLLSPAVLGCQPAFAMNFHSFGVLQTADLMTEH